MNNFTTELREDRVLLEYSAVDITVSKVYVEDMHAIVHIQHIQFGSKIIKFKVISNETIKRNDTYKSTYHSG